MRSQTVLQIGLGIILTAGAVPVSGATDASGGNKDMVLIPKGEFTMGSNEHSDESRHQVVLDAYLIEIGNQHSHHRVMMMPVMWRFGRCCRRRSGGWSGCRCNSRRSRSDARRSWSGRDNGRRRCRRRLRRPTAAHRKR